MNTDRELLELAAKAAGLTVIGCYDGDDAEFWVTVEPRQKDLGWNPLADDGDALRLAVQLGLDLSLHGDSALAGDIYNDQWDSCEVYGMDKLAAVRRAIVVAAAEYAK